MPVVFPYASGTMDRTARLSLLALLCLTLFGCASLPSDKRDPRDPWERMNRTTYRVNEVVDNHFSRPIAKTYRQVTPQFVQTGVSNFMDNFHYTITIVNDLLQLKLKNFCSDTGRLLLNMTLGVGGLFDPATRAGLEKHDEDFGQTLGWWGLHPGPYLVLPILGPSDVRDAFGSGVDGWFFSPTTYIQYKPAEYTIAAVTALDTRARLLDTEKALEGAYDRYALIRTAYLQRRQYQVTDGKAPDEKQDQQQYEDEKKIYEETEGTPPPNPPPPNPK